MKKYRVRILYTSITLAVLFFTPLTHASSETLCIKKQPSWLEENPKEFSYFPQGFCTFSTNPSKLPLVTGPCSPCCALFVSDPKTEHTLGFHIAPNNCLKSIIKIIDKHFPQQDNIKHGIVVTLFSHAHTALHKHIRFTEGSHKNRFLAIFNMVHAKYNILNYKLYFNDTESTAYPTDRWIMFQGLRVANKPVAWRVNPYAITPGEPVLNFDRYKNKIYAETFGSMKAFAKFLNYKPNESCYETGTHTRSNIQALPDLHIQLLKDGLIIQVILTRNIDLFIPLILKPLSNQWCSEENKIHMTACIQKFVDNHTEELTNLCKKAKTTEISEMFTRVIASNLIKTESDDT